MEKLFQVDWQSVFVPTESLFEIFLRGSIMYLVMFTLLRVFRRQAGSLGIADLLVIVVIADAAQNGMAGDSKSVTEAVLLISTIVLWDYAFDFLGFKSKFFARILEPKKLKIIENGNLLRENLRKEYITTEELLGQLRQAGIERPEDVKVGYLESDGHFSFIKKDADDASKDESPSNAKQDNIVN